MNDEQHGGRVGGKVKKGEGLRRLRNSWVMERKKKKKKERGLKQEGTNRIKGAAFYSHATSKDTNINTQPKTQKHPRHKSTNK